MFISVHVNSFKGNTKDRTQIYTHPNKNRKSVKLSKIMEKKFDSWIPKHEKISKTDKFKDKNNKTDYAQSMSANYAVIRNAEAQMKVPSVLWEVGFIVARKGRERISNPRIMNNYSDIMAQSVVEYFS